ncbi:MAG: hypothetical protein EXS58_16740 [Candidatus Latescibacteria bacterium]|nr:hypothetical protein [Candidatus Latescibacterota bacterium]
MFIASVFKYPPRNCWRITYSIYLDRQTRKRKLKYTPSKALARLMAGQLEQLEEIHPQWVRTQGKDRGLDQGRLDQSGGGGTDLFGLRRGDRPGAPV